MRGAVFDLKRPCKTCPFRVGHGSRFRLYPERLEKIRRASAFQCHNTVEYEDDEDEPSIIEGEDFDEQWRPIKNMERAQQCAGLMAVLTRQGEPNQIMQVAERLGQLDTATLDPKAEAYLSWGAALRAHEGEEP
jgi:hypothetical protein